MTTEVIMENKKTRTALIKSGDVNKKTAYDILTRPRASSEGNIRDAIPKVTHRTSSRNSNEI